MKEYLLNNIKEFKQNFKLTKSHWQIGLIQVIIIALFALGIKIWQIVTTNLAQKALQLQSTLSGDFDFLSNIASTQINNTSSVAVLAKFILITTILIIYMIVVWSVLKQKEYHILTKTKFNVKLCLKFLLMTFGIGIVNFGIFYLLQGILFKISNATFQTSTLTRSLDFIAVFTVFNILAYWTTNYFYNFTKTTKIIQSFKLWPKVSIKKIKHFVLPTILIILGLIMINLVAYPIMQFSSTILFIYMTIIILFYIVIVKMYYVMLIERLEIDKEDIKKIKKDKIKVVKKETAKKQAVKKKIVKKLLRRK